MNKLIFPGMCLLLGSGCAASSAPVSEVPETVKPPVEPLVSGIDISHFDTSVRPQDDLYRYVNGAWLNSFEIPADKSNYGTFTKLAEEARENVKAIVEDAANSNAEAGTDRYRVGALYNSFMNEERLEERGLTPLQEDFAIIDGLSSLSDLSEHIARADIIGTSPFYVYVGADSKAPDTYIVHIGQSGLGLPEREYYFNTGERSEAIRKQYVEHIARSLTLAGLTHPEKRAKAIFDLEKALAAAHWTKEKNRDPTARYNKMTWNEVQALTKNLDWDRWRKASMVPEFETLLVAQPDYFEALNQLLTKQKLRVWKSYFKWHLIRSTASFLNKAMFEEHFSFYRKALTGVEEPEPRWKRGVEVVNGALGEVVGKIYVERHFKPEAKQRMQVLVENLRSAYATSIKGLDWMSDETKVQALEKLSKFSPKIGYPDKWRDYSGFQADAEDLYGNIRNASIFDEKWRRERLGTPVDRTEWHMYPQTVNAYYNPVMNEIVFPAAILQPPFFNLEADDAVNYGGIGAVIGHEMGHGFDDKGSSYDGDGKLRNWWTETDLAEFQKRTKRLVEQYSGFTVLDGVHVNGEFTQGENIGDLGGLTIAHKAYQISLHGEEAPVIDELTGSQRVFVGWAQVWARKYRDEALRQRIKIDPHSPSEFRTNGTVRNMIEFHSAFATQPGDKMYLDPEERVKIW